MSRSKQTDEKKQARKAVGERRSPFASGMDFETSEAYNVLRTNIILSLPHKRRGNIVGTTSSAPHEGKSYTSVNLSYALAKNGSRTLLVSADMRKPTVEGYYEVPLSPGLSNLLVGSVPQDSLMEVIRPLPEYSENLFLLPAGDIPPTRPSCSARRIWGICCGSWRPCLTSSSWTCLLSRRWWIRGGFAQSGRNAGRGQPCVHAAPDADSGAQAAAVQRRPDSGLCVQRLQPARQRKT